MENIRNYITDEELYRKIEEKDPETIGKVAILFSEIGLETDDPYYIKDLLHYAASAFSEDAAAKLKEICEEEKRKLCPVTERDESEPLTDENGEEIAFDCSGKEYPVEAVLHRENGKTYLDLNAKIRFVYPPAAKYRHFAHIFENAVRKGLKAWEGTYSVFDGHKVTFRVNLTEDPEADGKYVPISPADRNDYYNIESSLPDLSEDSFVRGAVFQQKQWSPSSDKNIVILNENQRYSFALSVEHVTKHEFGHVLGVGDVYNKRSGEIETVQPEIYRNLKPYFCGHNYFLTMDGSAAAPVSDLEAEMVLRAFLEKQYQSFITEPGREKISSALIPAEPVEENGGKETESEEPIAV